MTKPMSIFQSSRSTFSTARRASISSGSVPSACANLTSACSSRRSLARLRSGSSESVDEDVGVVPSGRVFTSASAAFWSYDGVSWGVVVLLEDGRWQVAYTNLRTESGQVGEEFCYAHNRWGLPGRRLGRSILRVAVKSLWPKFLCNLHVHTPMSYLTHHRLHPRPQSACVDHTSDQG